MCPIAIAFPFSWLIGSKELQNKNNYFLDVVVVKGMEHDNFGLLYSAIMHLDLGHFLDITALIGVISLPDFGVRCQAH